MHILRKRFNSSVDVESEPIVLGQLNATSALDANLILHGYQNLARISRRETSVG
jgi:hypothetical protein